MRQSWDFPWMEKSKVFRTKFALSDRATSKIIKIISFDVISFDSAFMRNCSETISRVCFVLNSRDDIQNLHYALYWRYIFTSHSLNAAFISMYLPIETNQRPHRKTHKNANLRKASGRKFNIRICDIVNA